MNLLIKCLLFAAMAQAVNARLQRSLSSSTVKGVMSTKPVSNSTLPGVKFATSTQNLPYNGGPVMLGTVNVYYIWYGNWASQNPGAKSLLENFATNIGGSDYWNIQTTYFDSNGNHMSNSVSFKGSVTYTQFSASLSGSDIATIVKNTITGGTLPLDSNGVYFVLTSKDINVENGGFCGSYCGWHTYQVISGQNIKYAFVGDAGRCPTSCAAQSPGPNNNAGADGMASVIAHELEETATDPLLNAWEGPSGENADLCGWTFGTTQGSSGQQYNMILGGVKYLIQQNLVLTDASGNGFCGLSVPPTTPTSVPSRKPSLPPTKQLTTAPSKQPTRQPSKQPTLTPTSKPTSTVTTKPTLSPTTRPTSGPTSKPTTAPSKQPTQQPSKQPTLTPTSKPTSTVTTKPTLSPTTRPTSGPTSKPTKQSTIAPSSKPVAVPTNQPTLAPNNPPTSTPTRKPTSSPTSIPTKLPTKQPTFAPSSKPTNQPVATPTSKVPTISPTPKSSLPYRGGPVMLGTVNVYYIWYGNWASSNSGAKSLLENLAKNIGGSDYWNIQTTYSDSNGNHLSNSVSFQGSVTYAQYSSSIKSSDIGSIVAATINSGTLPLDPNGVYFVLTDKNINVDNGGFCGSYCGWHDYQTISGQPIKYAFVGDAGRCYYWNSCSAQTIGPNGNRGADAMANTIAYELAATATDPLFNAWIGPDGENEDLCAWKFGTTQGSYGQQYNMKLGGVNYLIQQNYVNADGNGNGYCGLAVAQPTSTPTQRPTTKPTSKPTRRPSRFNS